MLDTWIAVGKVASAVIVSGLAWTVAQIELPIDGWAGLGVTGALAILVGRYTFRQLEEYRQDLKEAHERNDALQEDISELGRSKAELEKRLRDHVEYAHRLRLWAFTQGAQTEELPDPPDAPARTT